MRWLLLPFSVLYGIITGFRNFLYNNKFLSSKSFDIPVISVGNITVGGTGKTPHTEFLISFLQKNYKIAVLSRGYKRATKGFYLVNSTSTVKQSGDEPLQIKQKFENITVAVDENRVHGVNQLLKYDNVPDIVLLDDAYQHRQIAPGLSILLIDYNRPLKNDLLLPSGRLREYAHNTKRANIIILTKCPPNLKPIDIRVLTKDIKPYPYQNLYFTCFKYQNLKPVFGNNCVFGSVNKLKGVAVVLVTGIANPAPVYSELLNAGAYITKVYYPDHYMFTNTDIDKIIKTYNNIDNPAKVIVCTEKDAVRFKTFTDLSQIKNLNLCYLPIEVSFLNNGAPEFKNQVERYIKRYI